LCEPFVLFGLLSFLLGVRFLLFAEKRFFLVVARFGAIAVRRRPVVLLIDNLCRLFWRTLVLTATTIICLTSFIIFSPEPPSCLIAR
jgi:predicted membrane protein